MPFWEKKLSSSERQVKSTNHGNIYQPIVIGVPTPSFESKPMSDAYRLFPYKPDVAIDGWDTEQFSFRGVSIRGQLHRYYGSPRQDEFVARHSSEDRRVLLAVADGVSSAEQSHIASTIATRYAIDWLESNVGEDISRIEWRELFLHASHALVVQAENLFGVDASEDDIAAIEKIFATTLVCAVIDLTPIERGENPMANVAAIGDSCIWLLGEEGFEEIVSGKDADSDVVDSSVIALPRVPNPVESHSVELDPKKALVVATDGIGDPLGAGTGELGDLLRDCLLPEAPSLYRLAHTVDFRKASFDDDRTLAVIWIKSIAGSNDTCHDDT